MLVTPVIRRFCDDNYKLLFMPDTTAVISSNLLILPITFLVLFFLCNNLCNPGLQAFFRQSRFKTTSVPREESTTPWPKQQMR